MCQASGQFRIVRVPGTFICKCRRTSEARLRLEYGVKVESDASEGTTVMIRLCRP